MNHTFGPNRHLDYPEATNPGGTCINCEEPILEDESGWTSILLESADPITMKGTARLVAYHEECWIRQGVGSPAHLMGICSCSGQVEPTSDLSKRQEAQLACKLAGAHIQRKHP